MSILQSKGKQNHTYELCWQNTFLFKVFSPQGIEIEYSPQIVSSSKDDLSLGA